MLWPGLPPGCRRIRHGNGRWRRARGRVRRRWRGTRHGRCGAGPLLQHTRLAAWRGRPRSRLGSGRHAHASFIAGGTLPALDTGCAAASRLHAGRRSARTRVAALLRRRAALVRSRCVAAPLLGRRVADAGFVAARRAGHRLPFGTRGALPWRPVAILGPTRLASRRTITVAARAAVAIRTTGFATAVLPPPVAHPLLAILRAAFNEAVRPVHVDGDVPGTPVRARPAPVIAADVIGCAEADTAGHDHSRVIDSRRLPIERLVCRRPPRPVDDERVVSRNVDDLGDRRLDQDGAVIVDHALLRRVRQGASGLGALAQILHGLHYPILIGHERFAQAPRPVEARIHHVEHLGKRGQREHAGIPSLPHEGVVERAAGEPRVFAHEAGRLHDVQREGRRHEHLREELVRIQRDGREQRVELLLGERRIRTLGLIARDRVVRRRVIRRRVVRRWVIRRWVIRRWVIRRWVIRRRVIRRGIVSGRVRDDIGVTDVRALRGGEAGQGQRECH